VPIDMETLHDHEHPLCATHSTLMSAVVLSRSQPDVFEYVTLLLVSSQTLRTSGCKGTCFVPPSAPVCLILLWTALAVMVVTF